MTRRIIQAGVDEAGYAPTIGPLVATCVRLERPAAEPGLYELLGQTVSKERPRRRRDGLPVRRQTGGPAPIHVADSKKLHNSSKGIAALERNVLPFLRVALSRAGGQGPEDLTDISLAETLSGGGADLSGLDWYADAPEQLPVAAEPADVASATERLADALGPAGITGLDIRSRIVTARELNAAIARGLNKADLMVEVVASLIAPLAGEFVGPASDTDGPREATVLVDRLGGRKDYRALLGIAFPGAEVRELKREDRESSYSVKAPGGQAPGDAWKCGVSFACGAEDSCMTVALASMVSKYVRELFMARLNRWFAARVPGLKATAGYPVDARRFLGETAAFREGAGIADELFVRSR